jgi:hypothetical protein
VLTALFALVAVQAWGKQNYSGTWKMNAGKSDFGPIPAPDKMERTIQHEDPSLKIQSMQSGQQGEVKADLAYKTDGSESVNTVRGAQIKGVAAWKGDNLTISTKRDFQGTEITIVENWNMSEDGKVLTIVNKINTPQGDFETKVVFDKQ